MFKLLFLTLIPLLSDCSYLHITKLRPSCPDILESSNFDNIQSAIHQCNLKPSCTYVTNDSINGIYLCRSSSLFDLTEDDLAEIFIKPSILYGQIGKSFTHLMNYQGICDANEFIAEESLVASLEDACVKCRKYNCDYFTISTASGLKGTNNEYRNHAWFCRGFPKYIQQDGFITSIDKQYNDKMLEIMYNGPISL